ncbi:MAG: anaerobic C4-dicarboxylate transporter family protein [Bacteroidota bacterium]
MVWIQFAILLTMILIGARIKGIGLGLMGIVGMLIFVVGFGMRPADPPLDVMMIILSIVTTAAALQASGGLDYLVYVGEKIIRSNPSKITLIGPLVSYVLCLFAGTSHVIYSLLPVISEVALSKRIRPERPLSISVIASHLALTGSPMSACTAAMAAILAYPSAAVDIMMIGIPSCIIGVLAGVASVWKLGKDLDNDPVFLSKLKDPEFEKSFLHAGVIAFKAIKPGAKTAVFIFGLAIVAIVCCGAFPQILPHFAPAADSFSVKADGTLKMVTVIEIVTLTATTCIMLFTKTSALEVTRASLFTSMAAALVAVFGVVWMSSTFMAHNQAGILKALGVFTTEHPWTFTIAVFIMAALMFSQAATTRAMMPLGMALGISNPALIAMFPAVNSDFVLPGYPTLLAAINFDRTGSTHIGRFVINHSFIIPGLVSVATAVATGFLLSHWLL